MPGIEEDRALAAASLAVRRVLATAKNPRTLLHTYSPSSIAYHAAYAAIQTYKTALEIQESPGWDKEREED